MEQVERVERSKRYYLKMKLKDVACVLEEDSGLLLCLLKSWKRKAFMS